MVKVAQVAGSISSRCPTTRLIQTLRTGHSPQFLTPHLIGQAHSPKFAVATTLLKVWQCRRSMMLWRRIMKQLHASTVHGNTSILCANTVMCNGMIRWFLILTMRLLTNLAPTATWWLTTWLPTSTMQSTTLLPQRLATHGASTWLWLWRATFASLKVLTASIAPKPTMARLLTLLVQKSISNSVLRLLNNWWPLVTLWLRTTVKFTTQWIWATTLKWFSGATTTRMCLVTAPLTTLLVLPHKRVLLKTQLTHSSSVMASLWQLPHSTRTTRLM